MTEQPKEEQRARDGLLCHLVALAALFITFVMTEGQRLLHLQIIDAHQAESVLAVGFSAFTVLWVLSVVLFFLAVPAKLAVTCIFFCGVEIVLAFALVVTIATIR